MAQPARIGLSNPYDGRTALADARPARPRPAFARVAVLAGMSGAAAVGLGAGGTSSAWADSATAAPVPRRDGDDVSCPRLREPVMHTATSSERAGVAGQVNAVPWRCGVPRAWTRQRPLPVEPKPWQVRPRPVDPWLVDPAPVDPEPGLPVGDPMDGSQVVSVGGTVEAGVEPGCVVLRGGDGRQWTLVGPLRTLPHEIPLTITGTTSPGLLSTCQQGETLQVRQVELLDPDTEPGPAVPVATTDRLIREARTVPSPPVRIDVRPACGPVGMGKIPSVALCTR